MAEDWILCRVPRCGGVGHRAHGLDGQGIHLAGPGRGEVGEVLAGRIHFMDIYFFHLVPAVGGLVDLGNDSRIHLWLVERVSGFFSFGFGLKPTRVTFNDQNGLY